VTGPDGHYDDDHRATIFADEKGFYRFESNVPRPYKGRPSHIHIRISADGFFPLITQHYPENGHNGATLDIVIPPRK